MREKKYRLPQQSKRKINYTHLGMLCGIAVAALVLVIAAVVIVVRVITYDPFPEDASLTKEAGSVQSEISEEDALKIRYPSFEDEDLDQAVQDVVKQLRENTDGEDTVIDYRSKTIFDTYTSVLFKITKTAEDGSTKISYASMLYDGNAQKALSVDDVFRNQVERDLLDGRPDLQIGLTEHLVTAKHSSIS